MKHQRPISTEDDVAGWGETSRDERLWKYLRPHDTKVGNTVLKDMFVVLRDVKLPPSFLVDPTELAKSSTIDRGDVYEAFRRTEHLSNRGVFANGQPIWGTAEYRNGMCYTGMFKDGLPDGFGEKRAGSSVYRGRFKGGHRHGKGVYLNTTNSRLYVGTFSNDKPHGGHLCIEFKWDERVQRVTHSRTTVVFEHGVVLEQQKSDEDNVNNLSGMSYEEFLKIYREGEKSMEDSIARKILRDMKAPACLWQPVRYESYKDWVEKESV